MPITPLSGSESTESDEVWGDFSGGEIQFYVAAPGYTSHHIVRVSPFATDGSGTFTDSSGGKATTLQQVADDLITLVRALYAADTSVAAFAVQQVLSDHSGVSPYAYTFATTHFGAGTAGGASDSPALVSNLNSRGADGSRWRLTLGGLSSAAGGFSGAKVAWPSIPPGPAQDLVKYITGQTNGPVSSLKTQMVTHNGVPIQFSPGSNTEETNKRIRRHLQLV